MRACQAEDGFNPFQSISSIRDIRFSATNGTLKPTTDKGVSMSQATTTGAPEGTVKIETTLTMSVTDIARTKLQEFLGEKPLSAVGVRISVQAGGCSGASYGMEFAETPEAGEVTLNANGVKLFVHPMHASMLNGISIDFVDELMGGGFKIGNPNATGGCGCGKSFSA
jgi:iron-sulfur cluster assembly accessory protein